MATLELTYNIKNGECVLAGTAICSYTHVVAYYTSLMIVKLKYLPFLNWRMIYKTLRNQEFVRVETFFILSEERSRHVENMCSVQ